MTSDIERAIIEDQCRYLMPRLTSYTNSYQCHKVVELLKPLSTLKKGFKIMKIMSEMWGDHLENEGKSLLRAIRDANPCAGNHAVAYIEMLVGLNRKFTDFVDMMPTECKISFNDVIHASFKSLIEFDHSTPELLALFVDANLKKKVTDREADVIINKMLLIYTYLKDKQPFETTMWVKLSERLMNSCHVVTEGRVIFALKMEAEPLCTYRMESMMKDFSDSALVNHIYRKRFCQAKEALISVNIVNPLRWPGIQETSPSLRLPSFIAKEWEFFKQASAVTHPNRVLTVHQRGGTAQMRILTADDEKCTVYTSTYQMCILVLFNDDSALTFEQIKDKTGISDPDLKSALHPMVVADENFRILTKTPVTDTIETEALFKVNLRFNPNVSTYQVPQVDVDYSEAEVRKLAAGRPDEERQFFIECAIVRTLKRMRRMEEDEMITYVQEITSSRMSLGAEEIADCVDFLILKEYIKLISYEPRILQYIP